jgi:hypothetical protein
MIYPTIVLLLSLALSVNSLGMLLADNQSRFLLQFLSFAKK